MERIQKEGVEKARAEADAIVAAARTRAELTIKEAEQKAQGILEKAGRDGELFAARGRKAVEQAARDIVITVREAVQDSFRNLVNRDVNEALSAETLKQMLAKVVECYCRGAAGSARMQILVEPEQQKAILDFFTARYAQELRSGLEIKADESVMSGFKVRVADRKLEHSFSDEAITEALCRFLRPQLAEIVAGGAPRK